MNVYFCPACGCQNKYLYDKPTQCANCNVIFAKAFSPTTSYNKSRNTEIIQAEVDDLEEVTEVPQVTAQDVQDVIVESNQKSNRVTIGDVWNDKDGALGSSPREIVKIKGKKKLATKAQEILNSAKTTRKE